MAKIGIGVIGAGGIAARLHLPEIAAIDDFEIRLLAGRKQSRLDLLARRFGARTSGDYQAVVDSPVVDAIVVATPHPVHVEWGIAALRAGKHLLIQKPLCGDLREAAAFAEAAAEARSIVLCLPHFAPEIHQARKMVDAGSLGVISGAYARTSHGGPEVYYAEIRDLFGEANDGDLWFFDDKKASVGALFDMGVYAVAQLVAVLGSVTRVHGRVTTVDKPTPLEDCASLMLEFARGCVATAETSWCDPASTWELHVHGTKGKLVALAPHQRRLTHTTPGSRTREHAPPVVEQVDLAESKVGNAHEHWLECIRTDKQPVLSNWQAARHVTEVLLAGLESSRIGRPVEVHSRS